MILKFDFKINCKLNKMPSMAHVTQDVYLNEIIKTYYMNDSLSKDKHNKNYYLNWLENDMLFLLNDDKCLHEGLSPYLIHTCAHVIESILCNTNDDVFNNIVCMWNVMNDIQKKLMIRVLSH